MAGGRRPDPFSDVWGEVREQLEASEGLEAKTLFEYLQRRYPGRFQDGQLRTLQRKVKYWRATEGPSREVFFVQRHHPGRLAASDFTHMEELGVTIQGQSFSHLIYHFVLTYSNWETGMVCFSESFESLSEGLQNALSELVSAESQLDTHRGQITFDDLLRAVLRHRPDRITVGEVRGPEARTLLDAMNTSHRGTLATIHASSAEEAIHRVATLVMRGSSGLSIDAIKDDVRRGIDLIVYIHREQGKRRVHEILDLAAH